MIDLSKNLSKERIYRRLFLAGKHTYQAITPLRAQQKQILMVVGCQRSGTTLIQEIIERDLNAKVYLEHSKLSARDERHLRLNPLPEVKAILDRDNAALIVMKPLAEIQNITKLLDFFPTAKVLWMYRHYADVAISKLKKSGLDNGIRDMQYIVERRDHWRSENVPEAVREIVAHFYAADMNPYDAAALYWYVRNNFFFAYDLAHNPRVMMCKYEEFVTRPVAYMQQIYAFVAKPFPTREIVTAVYASSVGKGAQVMLSPEVEALCQGMLERLNGVYEGRYYLGAAQK